MRKKIIVLEHPPTKMLINYMGGKGNFTAEKPRALME